jgi:hypothetical protein
MRSAQPSLTFRCGKRVVSETILCETSIVAWGYMIGTVPFTKLVQGFWLSLEWRTQRSGKRGPWPALKVLVATVILVVLGDAAIKSNYANT